MSGWLQKAVAAYTSFITGFQAEPEGERRESLCDAVLALATLIMQSGDAAAARQFLQQAKDACAGEAAVGAASSVLALVVAEKRESIGQALADLSTQAALLENRQAALQATLWLALGLESADKKQESRAAFERSANLARQMRQSGEPFALAPHPLSLVGFFGAFDVRIGYSSESPFGVELEVGIRPRLQLFPPAAVDQKRLEPFLEQSGSR